MNPQSRPKSRVVTAVTGLAEFLIIPGVIFFLAVMAMGPTPTAIDAHVPRPPLTVPTLTGPTSNGAQLMKDLEDLQRNLDTATAAQK